jgi:hypothetical protein
MLHYRSTSVSGLEPELVPGSTTRRPLEAGSTSDRIVLWLTWAILGVVLFVWAIIGAIFWLPLLVRTMVRFSVSLVQSTMDAERPEGPARTLRDAVSFYRRGFVVAIDAVMREDTASEGTTRREYIDRHRLTREALWALAIWYPILWWLGIAWSPAELWSWIAGLPWGEALGSLANAITSGIDGLVGTGAEVPAEAPAAPTIPVPTG